MRALFITRKHPPSVGGMEQLSHQLVSGMRAMPGVQVTAIAWRHSQWLLPAFLIVAFFRSMVSCIRGVDVIHIGDPVLSGMGLLLRAVFRVPVAITVHGLDLTFGFPPYQAVIPRWVARYDRIIAISHAVHRICLQHGIPAARCEIIHPGVDLPDVLVPKAGARRLLSDELGHDLSARRLLITVGRLVPRKGVHFFVSEVLPRLVERDPDYFFLVVGQGAERERILETARRCGLDRYIQLAGYLAPEALQNALFASDLFVAPNIPQAADMEGFGLVVLEAAASGCAVLAADIEGLRDTLPEPGFDCFVPAGDAERWVQRIETFFESPEQQANMGESLRAHVGRHNSWQRMVSLYADVLRRLSRHE